MMRQSSTINIPTPTRCKFCLPEKRGLQAHLQSLKLYAYRPLQTPSSIRALKLILEPDEHHIRVQLEEIDLESKDTSYAALSYTWGANETPHSIECDGQQIAVTCNLYSALHRLRELRLDVAIFVDALCINQGQELEALREREKQVMMMGRIYSQAVRVIVDLGDASNDSIRAIEFLEKVASFNTAAWESILLDASAGGSDWSAHIGDIPWEPLMDLVSRQWFTRAWVIQEFVLAKQLSILLGMSYLKEDALTLAIERFRQLIAKMVYAPVSTDGYFLALHSTSIGLRLGKCRKHLKLMSDVRKNLQESGSDSIPLTVALSISQGFDTTDNRDRVYSVLGTVRRFEAEKVEVNYRGSNDQTSLQVSHVLIQQGFILPLLHNLANRNPNSNCSWALDLELGAWTTSCIDQQVLPDGTCACPQLQACADTRLGSPLVYLESRSLELTGFLSEKIMAVSDYFPDPAEAEGLTADELAAKFLDWYDNTFNMVNENIKHTYPGDLETSFITATLAEGRLTQYAETGGDILNLTGDLSGWVHGIKTAVHEGISGFEGCSDEMLLATQLAAGFSIMSCACLHRCIAVTESGMLCIAPQAAEVGDIVAVIEGGPIPFLLRPKKEYFHLIGSIYVQGIMDGEAVRSAHYEATRIILR